MKISEELKRRILESWQKVKPLIEQKVVDMKFTTRFDLFPIAIDGVIDSVRYNVQEKRFDQIEIEVATKGLIVLDPDLSNGQACYCDESETVIIPLSRED